MVDEKCVKCGGVVDPRGVNGANGGTRYCQHVCQWPPPGCGARIFFAISSNEKVQPFDLETRRPHHATCRAFIAQRDIETMCPSCGGKRRRGSACRHCGYDPAHPERRSSFHVTTLMRFDGGGPGGDR